MKPLLRDKQEMTIEHRNVRTQLDISQNQRWNTEEQKHIARIRKGFKRFLDKLNGRYWKTRNSCQSTTIWAWNGKGFQRKAPRISTGHSTA